MKNSRLIITTIITLLITYSAKSQPVIADFQVNENLTNRWVQDAPIVLVHSNSNYMVVWKDDRELVGVFAQVFSSDGTPLSDDFQLVGAQSSSAYNETFAAAVNENGTFVIVWKGGGNFPRVFAQLFDSSGAAIGENFPVTEYVGNTTESFPSVVFGKDDTFIICIDARNPHSLYGDIFARRFAPDGTPLGSEFKVNDDGGTLTRQERADISSNSNGEFVITWEDFRVDFNGGDIYAQRYDSDGNHLGPNLFVDLESPVDRIRQTDPVCSLDDSGKFMIVWNTRAWDHSNPDIFAQFYDGDGNRIDSNFVVTDPTYSISDLQPEEPAVAVNENGKFLVSWTDFRNNNDDIFTQLYESNGTAIGSNFKINDDGGESAQSSPDVATNNNGEFIFTWWDYRNDGFGSQIYLQRCTENGSPIGGNFHTTNEGTVMVPTIEGDPNIVVDSQGAFMVVWIDLREIPGPGIYAQRYESNGTPIDSNFQVNDDGGENNQYMVSAAVSDEGKNLIAWFDRRNVYDAVYGQLYLGSGAAVGGNFQVSDTLAVVGFSRPSSAALGNNTFIFVWQDKRNNHTDIYARRIDGSGTALDNSFKVNDDQGADGSPVVAVNNSGVYLVAWSDQSHESDPAIYAQLYSAEATALGTNIKINDNTGGEFVTAPAISAYGNSNFVVAWVDNTNKDIYAQLVAGDGTLISSNFQVGPDGPSQWHGPAIATDEAGNFIVAWDDDRNQAWPLTPQEIFAQRYNSDGTPLGTDFKVSGNSDDPYEYPPKVKLFNNNIYTVWSERDRFDLGTGVDIWANVLDWDNPVISDTREVNLNPIEFTLMQNYPNPFNPNTTIKYSIPKESQVTLKVYNVLGSEVYTIINKEQSPGNYKAEFHAPSISSGVYFYKLKAGEFVETKKMVLLK